MADVKQMEAKLFSVIRARRTIAVLVLLTACKGTPPPPSAADDRAAAGQHMEDEFLRAYRAAHESGDVEAAMRLVHLEGVSEQLQAGLRRAFRTDFERQLDRVELVDLESAVEESTIEGQTYRANLKTVKELRVEFVRLNTPDGEISGRNRPVGVANGRYYIASTIVSGRR